MFVFLILILNFVILFCLNYLLLFSLKLKKKQCNWWVYFCLLYTYACGGQLGTVGNQAGRRGVALKFHRSRVKTFLSVIAFRNFGNIFLLPIQHQKYGLLNFCMSNLVKTLPCEKTDPLFFISLFRKAQRYASCKIDLYLNFLYYCFWVSSPQVFLYLLESFLFVKYVKFS